MQDTERRTQEKTERFHMITSEVWDMRFEKVFPWNPKLKTQNCEGLQ
jgi:hypothetical protein